MPPEGPLTLWHLFPPDSGTFLLYTQPILYSIKHSLRLGPGHKDASPQGLSSQGACVLEQDSTGARMPVPCVGF